MQKIKLKDFLNGMRESKSASDLEAAIQVPYPHDYFGKTWTRICNVRISEGERICKKHPLAKKFVPTLGARNTLSVCGETYKVGYGQNAAGSRYVWAAAKSFYMKTVIRHGLDKDTASTIWQWWGRYPHRCIFALEKQKTIQ